ncbi:beta/gamma crystallin domain-containing protein 2 [Phasianus colchicus]|uniref:beta/gamma crystallin domain-containing protein 2 n=1 Tax=Phasianus colchicus TaxID=9054 RepID=UPI00129DD5C4|nr:beta/gamma crystallin domain-containing protein 2 [Phasianus colchicus]
MDLPFQHSEAKGFISSAELSMKQTAAPGPENRSRFQKVSLVSRRLEHTAGGGGRDGSPSRVSLLLQAWEREIVEKTASGPSAVTQRSCSSSVSILKDFAAHGPIFSQVFSPRRREEKREDDTVPAPRDVPVHRESYMHGVLLPTVPRCQRSTRDPKPKARHVTVLREGREAEEGRKTQNGMCKATTVPSLHQRGCKPDGGGITKITARGKSSLSAVDTRESSREKCSKPDESMPNATPRGRDKLQDLQTSTTSAQCPLTDWSGAGEGGAVHREGSISAIQPRTESYDEAGSTSKNISKKASNGPELLCGARASPKDSEVEMKEGEMMKNHKGVAQDTQSIPEPPMESTAKPQPESIPKPQPEGVSKPQPEGVSKPQPEGVSKPQPESVPKLQSEGVPKPQPENVPKPQPESAPKLQSEGVPKLKSEGVPKPQDESTPKPQPESIPKPQADSVLKCQLDSVRKSQPEGVPKPQPESVPKPQPESAPKPQSEGVPKLKSEGVPKPQDESIPKLQPEGVPKPLPESTPKPQPESVPKPQSESISKPQIESIPEPPHESPAPPQSLPDASEEDPELVVDMEIFVDTLRNMEPSEIRKAPKVPRQPRPSALGRCPALPPIHEDHVAPRTHISLPVALQELLAWGGGGQRAETPPEDTENHDEEEEIENPYLSPGEKALRRAQNGNGELGSLLGGPTQGRATGERSILFRGNVLKGMALLSDFLEHHAASADEVKPYSRLDNSMLYSRFVSSANTHNGVSNGTGAGDHPSTELEALNPDHNPPVPEEPESARVPYPTDIPVSAALEQCLKVLGHIGVSDLNPLSIFPCFQPTDGALYWGKLCCVTPSAMGGCWDGGRDLLAVDARLWLLLCWAEAMAALCCHPNQIILFSEAGFAGQRREIWGDVPDATSWELSHKISIRVIRGGWVMYEKPRFHGRKCVLAEGDVEIDNPWIVYGQSDEPRGSRPFRIGSFKRVVKVSSWKMGCRALPDSATIHSVLSPHQDYRTPEISLFAEENGEGARLQFSDSAEDTRVQGQSLTASSIIVHSGLWLVYSKPFFDDDPYVLEPGGYPSLKAWGAKDPSICSMHPIRLGCPVVERPGEPQVLIYEDTGFQGHSFIVSRDIYDLKRLPELPLPTVGSMRVLGGCWVGYEKEGFRGHQYLLEEGEYQDWRQWGGYSKELMSLRLIRTDFSDPALVLFEAMDFEEGPSVELSEALPDTQLAGYGTVTQSIHVLSGVWVAYEGPNFSGEQYILEKGVYRNFEDWGATNCRIASAQPILQVREHNLHFVSKILLFSEPDFLGEHLAFEDEQSALPDSFVPRSCRVHGGSWILFDSQAFTGEQHVLSEGEYPTLGAMGCLSSTTIRSLKKVPVFFSEPSIFLHGLECFEGKEIELNNEVRSLQAEGFNNHVLSVRVKGGIWVLCEHGDFRGRQWLLECTEITNWLTYSGLQHVGSLYPIRQRRIYFRIRSKELQLYLSVPDDVEDMKAGRVVVSSLSEQSSSVWYYEDGLLKNQVAPAMSLQVIGPAGKGAKAVLWSETRMPRQTWSINSQGQIHSQMFEDMILDVKGKAVGPAQGLLSQGPHGNGVSDRATLLFAGGRSYDRDHAIIWEVAEERPTQIWEIQVL